MPAIQRCMNNITRRRQRQAGTAGSVEQLWGMLLPLPDKVRIVSFDIFDTLTERLIEPPDQVKRLAARLLTEALIRNDGRALAVDAILALRADTEGKLRRQSAEAGLDPECRFTAIAEAMAERLVDQQQFDLSLSADVPAIRDTIVASEIAAETRALRAKQGMAELLAEIKATGTRIVAISDMYLDGPLIRQLLDQIGLGNYIDAIYVSADHALGKYSGRLFQTVFEQESITAAELLHVGDNAVSDVHMPMAEGASAIHFHHSEWARRQQISQACKWLSDRNPYWRGRHFFAGLPAARTSEFFFAYGFETLGPIYTAFVAHVRETLTTEAVEHTYFLARDSELFQRLHTLLNDPALGLPPAPPATYLHISRKAVALPAAHAGLSVRQLQLLLPRIEERGLAAIAGAIGIEAEALSGLACRLGLESVSTAIDTSAHNWPELLAKDAEFQDLVKQRARGARSLLRRYLQQHDFFGAGRKLALVDIGWNGSIQRALKDAFGDDDDWPAVSGYYLSFNDNLGHELDAREACGLLFDKRTMHPRDNIFEHFEEVFENGARSLEATTIGYREHENGSVVPLFLADDACDRRAERDFDPLAKRLRDGALAFAAQFAKRYALCGYNATDLHPYVLQLARRAVFFPTRQQAEQLLRIVHAEDAGTDSVLDFSVYRLSGPALLLHPRRLLQILRQSHWKYGTGRSLGLPGFNHLLRLAHRLMIARHWSKTRRQPLYRAARPHWWETLLMKIVERGGMPTLLHLRDKLRRWR